MDLFIFWTAIYVWSFWKIHKLSLIYCCFVYKSVAYHIWRCAIILSAGRYVVVNFCLYSTCTYTLVRLPFWGGPRSRTTDRRPSFCWQKTPGWRPAARGAGFDLATIHVCTSAVKLTSAHACCFLAAGLHFLTRHLVTSPPGPMMLGQLTTESKQGGRIGSDVVTCDARKQITKASYIHNNSIGRRCEVSATRKKQWNIEVTNTLSTCIYTSICIHQKSFFWEKKTLFKSD